MTLAVAAISVAIAVYFLRSIPRALEGWTGKRRALRAHRRQERRARQIVAAVQLLDRHLAEPDQKVTDAAEIRAGLGRLLAVVAAEQLQELAAIKAKLGARSKRRFRLRRQ